MAFRSAGFADIVLGGPNVSNNILEIQYRLGLQRARQELGVEELIQKIGDAGRIATDKVQAYLAEYQDGVLDVVQKAQSAAVTMYTTNIAKPAVRLTGASKGGRVGNELAYTGNQIEAALTLAFKQKYEMEMLLLNQRYPLANSIVGKYMTQFAVAPSMKA